MLKTFFCIEGFVPLPGSGNLYSLDRFGTLLDTSGRMVHSTVDSDGNSCYDIYWFQGRKLYKTAFLLLIVFKPVQMQLEKTKHLDVDFIDSNNNNLSLENVVWRFPESGIETEPGSGFYHIPGYSAFSINKEGSVRNNRTLNILNGSMHDSGYKYYSVKEDVPSGLAKGKIVGRHRLLAFTFIHYPASADRLDVNHKNGIPGDDRIENLEWVTRQVNALHAYSTGLRPDNKIVIVLDKKTGKETEYFSTHDCENKLGLGRSMVHYRIKHGNGKFYPPGLSFRYKNGTIGNKAQQIAVICTNKETMEKHFFPSIKKCAEKINISKKCISRRLKDSDRIELNGYSIEKHCSYKQ